MGKTPTMTPQNADILEYMRAHGKITTIEAITKLGCTRLSARIWDLRHLGYQISGKTVSRKLPNGTVKQWKEYRLTAGM